MRITILFLFILSINHQLSAQKNIVRLEVIDGDTVAIYTFDEVLIKSLADPEAEKRYLRLVRDIKKTLPYAKAAAYRLQLMEDNLRLIKSERDRKAYVKKTEKAIKQEFMAELKNLTMNQGRLLIKLIHRETGKTSFELLNKYTNPFTSIFWQGMAKVYGTSLKEGFDPMEQYQIEYIIKSLELE